jgi:hypothetical protein
MLINGSTIFSLIGFPIDKSINPHKIKPSHTNWTNINHLIIDEVSMVGCNMLVDIHLKLQTLKENILLFGFLNIIFMLGFLWFPLINDCPLCFNNIKLVFSFTKQTPKEVIGKNLWENYVCFNKIILPKQMRQVEDVHILTYL